MDKHLYFNDLTQTTLKAIFDDYINWYHGEKVRISSTLNNYNDKLNFLKTLDKK